MTSAELCGYFFQSIKLQRERGIPPNLTTENTSVAILFAKEEVTFDLVSCQIHLPGLGPVEIEVDSKLNESPQFDWVATVKDQTDESWNIILGCGNPYSANLDQGLPVLNGAVIAVPACLSPVFKK
jgi:hypothetical protein